MTDSYIAYSHNYTVNHNGTEDWTEVPEGAVRRPDGRLGFATVEDAGEFGADVARDAIAWQMRDRCLPYDEARESLRDTEDGVPVQIVDARTGNVVGVIDPDTIAPQYPPES